jgi:hypothetical protein
MSDAEVKNLTWVKILFTGKFRLKKDGRLITGKVFLSSSGQSVIVVDWKDVYFPDDVEWEEDMFWLRNMITNRQ